jgi:hypothetical protein
MVYIKPMVGRFKPPDEIQGPDSLCIGGELLFRPEKRVTGPQVKPPLSTRKNPVPKAVLSLPRAVIGEIYCGLKVIR